MGTTAVSESFFSHPCVDGVELVLRDLSTTVEMHELTVANIERLRRWEQWAQPEPTLPRTFEYTRRRLDDFTAGAMLPCAIRVDGALVGSVELCIDTGTSTSELGVWVDAGAEGRGIARAACEAVLDHAFGPGRLQRVEARIATINVRSRRLAEQLGFTLEGTLRSACLVGADRQDLAVYGLIAEEWAAQGDGEARAAA
ncbi:MAG: GNAT family N-acetyltransferase [Acidobacteria bacterium]|nr:GNAT family N-acetyltransferase [Acidobacteriota bacterium]